MTLERIFEALSVPLEQLGVPCDARVLETWIRRRSAGREALPLDAVRAVHAVTGSLLEEAERGAV